MNTSNKMNELFLTLYKMKESTLINIDDLYKSSYYDCDDEFFLDMKILIETQFENIKIINNDIIKHPDNIKSSYKNDDNKDFFDDIMNYNEPLISGKIIFSKDSTLFDKMKYIIQLYNSNDKYYIEKIIDCYHILYKQYTKKKMVNFIKDYMNIKLSKYKTKKETWFFIFINFLLRNINPFENDKDSLYIKLYKSIERPSANFELNYKSFLHRW